MSWMRQQQSDKLALQTPTRTVDKASLAKRPELTAPPEADKEFGIWLATAKMDWDRLKAIPDHAERDRLAPGLLEKYREFLAEWMARGETHQNGVLVMNIVWAVNAQRWDVLLPLADYAVKTQQVLTFFDRDLPTFVADSVRDYAEHLYKVSQQGQDKGELTLFELPQIFRDVLSRIVENAWMVNYVSVAKCHKLAGLEAEAHRRWHKAVEHYTLANQYPNVGVKTRLENAQKHLSGIIDSSPQAAGTVGFTDSPTGQSEPLTASGQPVFYSDGRKDKKAGKP